MTPKELEKLCDQQEALGLGVLVLTMHPPRSWLKRRLHPERIRTPFGLVRWYPSNQETVMIYVEIAKARGWLAKVKKQAPNYYSTG